MTKRHALQLLAVLVERRGVAITRLCIELDFEFFARLGLDYLQFTVPWRHTILVGPELNQEQLVAELGEVLQRMFALATQEIRDDNQQTALEVSAGKLTGHVEIVGLTPRFEPHQEISCSGEAVASTRAYVSIAERRMKRVDHHSVQTHQADIGERTGELAGVLELRRDASG